MVVYLKRCVDGDGGHTGGAPIMIGVVPHVNKLGRDSGMVPKGVFPLRRRDGLVIVADSPDNCLLTRNHASRPTADGRPVAEGARMRMVLSDTACSSCGLVRRCILGRPSGQGIMDTDMGQRPQPRRRYTPHGRKLRFRNCRHEPAYDIYRCSLPQFSTAWSERFGRFSRFQLRMGRFQAGMPHLRLGMRHLRLGMRHLRLKKSRFQGEIRHLHEEMRRFRSKT